MNIRTQLFILVCSALFVCSALSQPQTILQNRINKKSTEPSWLKNLPDSVAIDTLTKLYNDSNTENRHKIIYDLLIHHSKFAYPFALKALKDSSSGIRSTAIIILDVRHDTSDIPLLLSALHDKDRDVRYAASRALQQFADPRAVTPLLELFDHKDPRDYYDIFDHLLPYKDDRIALKLMEKLNNNESSIRKSAIIVLGKRHDTVALPAIIESLHDTIYDVVNETINTLREMNDSRAIQPLVDMLSLPDIKIRYIAIDAIMDLPDSARIQRFLELSKKSGYAHDGALQGIAECGGKVADSVFSRAIKEKNVSVIAAGYRYFIRKGDSSTISILSDVMLTHGNFVMAIDYACSGCNALKSAAYKWSKLMGFKLQRFDLPDEIQVTWGQPRIVEQKSHEFDERYFNF